MFENPKLDVIKKRLKSLEETKGKVENGLREVESAYGQTLELYALGELEQTDLNEATKMLKSKKEEIEQLDIMIQKVKSVRKTVAIESLPFVRDVKAKKIAAIQSKYDEQVKAVHHARAEFLSQLAKLGAVVGEVGSVNNEFNIAMTDAGENPSHYGSAIQQRVIVTGGYTAATECLGVDESTQTETYRSGRVSNGFVGASL